MTEARRTVHIAGRTDAGKGSHAPAIVAENFGGRVNSAVATRKTSGATGSRNPGDRASVLEPLRRICLSMPGAVEKLSHGEPTWFAGPKGKVFAMFDDHHHGAAHISVWVPATHEVQEMLVAEDPERYWVPPYVGQKGWVAIVLDTDPDWRVIERLVQEAFATVAPPKRTPRRRGAK